VQAKLLDGANLKVLVSKEYNYTFNKITGHFCRWGKTKEDDPSFSPFGPEILDIEISQGKCSGNCPFCVPKRTNIKVSNGEKKIENIEVGDEVVSYDTYKKEIRKNTVIETYVREYTGEMIVIELENNTIIKLTPDHEVFTNQGLIQAKNLDESMEILSI